MAGTAWTTVHNSYVITDKEYPHRWIDAFGPNVRKYFLVDQYHPDSCTVTAVNASTITGLESSLGGGWVFTTAAADNDGVQMQPLSECFYFGGPYPAYFGARFKITDVDNCDAVLGFAVQDTSIATAVADAIYFRVVDNDAALTFVIENTNAETIVDLGDLTDATYVTAEFYYDGDTTVTYYLNDVEVGSVETSATNMPDDEHLAPAIALLTGAGGANAMTVLWARWIQILE
jgi:hypothetical protein